MSFTEVTTRFFQKPTNDTYMKSLHKSITTGKQGLPTKQCYFCVKNNLPGSDTHFQNDCVKKEEYIQQKFGPDVRLTAGNSSGEKRPQDQAHQAMGSDQEDYAEDQEETVDSAVNASSEWVTWCDRCCATYSHDQETCCLH